MAAILSLFVVVLLAMAALPQGGNAIHYTFTNQVGGTPAGARFDYEIGARYTLQVLDNSTQFIWSIFHQQNTACDRKNISTVNLFLERNMPYIADTENNEIHVDSKYIQYYKGDIKTEFTGILFHEMTHVWQWFGNSSTPTGLIEGIADYVRLKAGYVPKHWVRPGEGDRWDRGYDVTAFFLDYCNCLRNGFVAQLNQKMKNGYSDCYFVELLGKTPQELFSDYKSKYQ